MWRKQVAVVAGTASAAAVLAVLRLRGPHEFRIAVPAGDDAAARLAFLPNGCLSRL
jgi:hypothetical protein